MRGCEIFVCWFRRGVREFGPGWTGVNGDGDRDGDGMGMGWDEVVVME